MALKRAFSARLIGIEFVEQILSSILKDIFVSLPWGFLICLDQNSQILLQK